MVQQQYATACTAASVKYTHAFAQLTFAHTKLAVDLKQQQDAQTSVSYVQQLHAEWPGPVGNSL